MSFESKKLAEAESRIRNLEEALALEQRQRKQVEESARMNERALGERIARLERTQQAAHLDAREAAELVASAGESDLLRQRVGKLEFGIGFVEVGPMPEVCKDGRVVVVRVAPGTTPGQIAPVLSQLSRLIAMGETSLDPRRGSWELVRATPAACEETLELEGERRRRRTRHRDEPDVPPAA